jgi:hypothetical protein
MPAMHTTKTIFANFQKAMEAATMMAAEFQDHPQFSQKCEWGQFLPVERDDGGFPIFLLETEACGEGDAVSSHYPWSSFMEEKVEEEWGPFLSVRVVQETKEGRKLLFEVNLYTYHDTNRSLSYIKWDDEIKSLERQAEGAGKVLWDLWGAMANNSSEEEIRKEIDRAWESLDENS